MSLNPKVTKDKDGVYWGSWDPDPSAEGYAFETQTGASRTFAPEKSKTKIGANLQEPVTFTIAALDVTKRAAESAQFPPVVTPPPPPPGKVTMQDLKGACVYSLDMALKAKDLAGMTHVRSDWPGDSFMTGCKGAGIEALPILCYGQGLGKNGDHSPPGDMDAWAAKAAAFVDKHSPKAAEVWNEPWLRGFWAPQPDPATYMKLVRTVALKIWQTRPDTLIVVSADEHGDTPVNGTNGWIGGVIAADSTGLLKDPRIRPSVHTYCWNRTPEDRQNRDYFGRFDNAYKLFKAHGHPDPMNWVTELGWDPSGKNGLVSEQQQADFMVRGLKLMLASGMVERAYVYQFKIGDPWYAFLPAAQRAVKALT